MRSAIMALALAASMFGGELVAEGASLPGAWDDFGAVGDDTRDEFRGEASTAGTSGADSAAGSGSTANVDTVVVSCAASIPSPDRHPACVLIAQAYLGCPDGTTESLSWFRRTRAGTGEPWGEWQLVNWEPCYTASPSASQLAAAAASEWTSLAPTPTPLNLQPSTGWVYATVPTIAFTDDTPVIHDATLLGVPVRIRATPSQFTWSWGDGEETSTADAGSPYPDYSLSHTYLHFEGDLEVTLETTWSGDYSVNGGPWIDIDGTISTQSGPVAIEVLDPQSRLVDCDLNNNCLVGAG